MKKYERKLSGKFKTLSRINLEIGQSRKLKNYLLKDSVIPQEKINNLRRENKKKPRSKTNENDDPLDWRQHHSYCNTDIIDLGNCGGSYVFQIVRAIQQHICQAKGQDVALSF